MLLNTNNGHSIERRQGQSFSKLAHTVAVMSIKRKCSEKGNIIKR